MGPRRKERGTGLEWVGSGKSDRQPSPGLGPGRQCGVVATVTARKEHSRFSLLRTEEYLWCLFLPALIPSGPRLIWGTNPPGPAAHASVSQPDRRKIKRWCWVFHVPLQTFRPPLSALRPSRLTSVVSPDLWLLVITPGGFTIPWLISLNLTCLSVIGPSTKLPSVTLFADGTLIAVNSVLTRKKKGGQSSQDAFLHGQALAGRLCGWGILVGVI